MNTLSNNVSGSVVYPGFHFWGSDYKLMWALVSPDGLAPSRMVSVSASFSCTIKSRRFLALAHPGGPGKRAVQWLWCGVVVKSAREKIVVVEGGSCYSVLMCVSTGCGCCSESAVAV